MQQKLINKIKQWRISLDKYDKAAINAAKDTLKISEARNDNEVWKLEELKTKYKESILKLEQQDVLTEKIREEAIRASNEIDDKYLRGSVIQLLMSTPEFAGLDEKAFEAIKSDSPSLDTVSHVHQIYIEHSKMIADKILEALKD